MGRVMGFEPMHIGTTIRGLNRLTTPAITVLFNYTCYFSKRKSKTHSSLTLAGFRIRQIMLTSFAVFVVTTPAITVLFNYTCYFSKRKSKTHSSLTWADFARSCKFHIWQNMLTSLTLAVFKVSSKKSFLSIYLFLYP